MNLIELFPIWVKQFNFVNFFGFFVLPYESFLALFLLIDARDRSRITSDHHLIRSNVSLYPLWFFKITPFTGIVIVILSNFPFPHSNSGFTRVPLKALSDQVLIRYAFFWAFYRLFSIALFTVYFPLLFLFTFKVSLRSDLRISCLQTNKHFKNQEKDFFQIFHRIMLRVTLTVPFKKITH